MTWSLGIIGCGKMAYALLKGIRHDASSEMGSVYICDPDQTRINLFMTDYKAVPLDLDDLIRKSEVVILAVKPGQVKEVFQKTQNCWHEQQVLVSIAAGIKTVDLERQIPVPKMRVVRVMPNTPCLVGEGMSAVCGGTYASRNDLDLVQSLLNSSGQAVLVQEQDMDAITAVSGSGPAYVFLLVEAMLEAAVNVGLSANTARQLVLQTFKGSISMLEASQLHPADLKVQVCSPGGTTIAGVRQLEAGGVRKAFFDAIEAAYERSINLGKSKTNEEAQI